MNGSKQLKAWELAIAWAWFALMAVMSAVSFRQGDHAWGLTFALLAAFFAVFLASAHAQRRWNRDGEPDWVKRARQRRR